MIDSNNDSCKKLISDSIKKNLIHIKKNIEKKEYTQKIRNWSDKFHFNYFEILEKVRKDEHFRAFFAKDPLRQNVIQKFIEKKILNIKCVFTFKKLNAKGENSLYLENGRLNVNNDKKDKPTKPIHFSWNIKKLDSSFLKCYAYSRYIGESGGSQDNQFNDMKNVIKNVSPKQSAYFFLICDGDYFTKDKLNEMKELRNSNKYCILTSTPSLAKDIEYLTN